MALFCIVFGNYAEQVGQLTKEENRELFPHADDPDGGFCVALIIDNTINAMNRGGGGPTTGGV